MPTLPPSLPGPLGMAEGEKRKGGGGRHPALGLGPPLIYLSWTRCSSARMWMWVLDRMGGGKEGQPNRNRPSQPHPHPTSQRPAQKEGENLFTSKSFFPFFLPVNLITRVDHIPGRLYPPPLVSSIRHRRPLFEIFEEKSPLSAWKSVERRICHLQKSSYVGDAYLV